MTSGCVLRPALRASKSMAPRAFNLYLHHGGPGRHQEPASCKMVAVVGRMLALHCKLAVAPIPADKKLYQRQKEVVPAADRGHRPSN